MDSLRVATANTLSLFTPPYDAPIPCAVARLNEMQNVNDWKGCALVWQLTGSTQQVAEAAALRTRASGFPLLVMLPPPAEVPRVIAMLPAVRMLSPRIFLPYGVIDSPSRLRQVLALAPRNVPVAVTEYLVRRGCLRKQKLVGEFRRIMELAPDTHSINGLARRMYTSRRTLGRHFLRNGLPVPSHCLQFGRLLHAALALHAEDTAVFRIARRLGYPDGFTMSNQMKRLTGFRPSDVRDLLGWEWILEAWLEREGI